MFLPWVVITEDFTRFLPAGKNTFGHGKNGKNSNTKNSDQNHMKMCMSFVIICSIRYGELANCHQLR